VDSIGPILKVVLPIGLGVLLVQTRILAAEDGRGIRKLCVRLTVPLLVFTNVYGANLGVLGQVVPMMGALFVMSALFFVVGWGVSRLVAGTARRTAVHAVVALGNYGWIGWAVNDIYWGEAGFQRAIFFTLLFWPMFCLAGIGIGAVHRATAAGQGPWRSMLALAGPVMGSLAAGAALNVTGVPVPGFLMELFGRFGGMTVPLILLSVGVQLEFRAMHTQVGPAAVGTLGRMLAAPAVGLAVLWAVRATVGCDEVSARVILLESVMPVAAATPVLASDHLRMDLNVVGAAIVLTTLVSLALIPLWAGVIPSLL
jgi:predicted permease